MALEGAWRATVQQLYRWRPLSRYWPLRSEVRDLVRRLGCARRGSRAGTRKAVRTNVNKPRSADRDAVAIPTITSVRRPVATSLQRHVGRRDARLPVRHPIELVAVQSSLLRCGLLNVCSLGKCNMPATVCDTIISANLDAFVAVETWHDDAMSPALALACPPDYSVAEKARPRPTVDDTTATNHGGIAVFYKSLFMVSHISLPVSSQFESLAINLMNAGHKLIVLAVYRTGTISNKFFEEFENVLETILSLNLNFVILGDFNIHVDERDDAHGARLRGVFEAYGLRQHINEPTHKFGHTLDLVLTAETTSVNALETLDMEKLSDHKYVCFSIPHSVSMKVPRTVISRNWSNFDAVQYELELSATELATTLSDDVDYLFSLYNRTLTELIDKHAPQRTTVRKKQHHAPWFDGECYAARREVRRLERIHHRQRTPACHRSWRAAVTRYQQFLGAKQRSYYSGCIMDSAGDSRKLWRTMSGLMDPPLTQTSPITPSEFAAFFKGKVDTIRAATAGAAPVISGRSCSSTLTSYSRVTPDEIMKLLRHCPNKQCALDPMPTWVVKACSAGMSTIIAKLVNASFSSATFPSSMKHAVVRPSVKKASLDPSLLTTYRPISNLPFISKVLERVVAHQLTSYLNQNQLMPRYQSAYRRNHSTETALLKICNDALIAADSGMVTLVVLLDMSAAFDTVSHEKLLDILNNQFGLTGAALDWHRSYLTGRTYRVVANEAQSDMMDLDCGLPQGSSLGPLKWIIYAAELQDIVCRHGTSFHGFADDSQLSKSMFVSDIQTGKRAMLDCIADVEAWCRYRGLKLNADKSEVLWLGTRQQIAKLSPVDKDLVLPTGTLSASNNARNLGVIIDENLTFDVHARACSRACFYHLRRIRQVRPFLDESATRQLVQAFVTSRLDYCNALLANSTVAVRQRLQRIQNSAARLICSQSAYTRSTPLLQSLHWLPVEKRIVYKLCVLMFDVKYGLAPVYLAELCNVCTDERLRSTSRGDFLIPRTRTRTAESAFVVAGPSAWNALPPDLRAITTKTAFHNRLKTHLFSN